jgi:hypothetical protein
VSVYKTKLAHVGGHFVLTWRRRDFASVKWIWVLNLGCSNGFHFLLVLTQILFKHGSCSNKIATAVSCKTVYANLWAGTRLYQHEFRKIISSPGMATKYHIPNSLLQKTW